MSIPSDQHAERGRRPENDVEERDPVDGHLAESAETDAKRPQTDDTSNDVAPQPPKIDREFIRRVIIPELELYWSRKHGRKLP